MLRSQGYAVIISPEPTKATFDKFRCEQIGAGLTEVDTFSCCHCSKVVHVKPLARMDEFGSMCRNCMKMVCPACADGPCVPFEKRLLAMEQKEYIRRQYAMLG